MLLDQLDEIMPDYDRYLVEKQLSSRSIKQYKLLITKFIEYLDNEYTNAPKVIENVNDEHVLSFLELKSKMGSSVHNLDTYFKFIKYFFHYLYDKKTMKTLILYDIPGMVVDRDKYDREFDYFTIDEIINILDTAWNIYQKERNYTSFRNYIIIYIFAYAGLTLNELYLIDEDDIDFKNRKLTIKGVKYKSETRKIYISKNLFNLLVDYLKMKHEYSTSKCLFVSRQHNRLSPKAIQDSVKKVIVLSDIENNNRTLSPRTIRHTSIKAMIDNDVELPIICNITGLEIKTLYKYIEEFTSVPDIKEELYLEDHPIFAR